MILGERGREEKAGAGGMEGVGWESSEEEIGCEEIRTVGARGRGGVEVAGESQGWGRCRGGKEWSSGEILQMQPEVRMRGGVWKGRKGWEGVAQERTFR